MPYFCYSSCDHQRNDGDWVVVLFKFSYSQADSCQSHWLTHLQELSFRPGLELPVLAFQPFQPTSLLLYEAWLPAGAYWTARASQLLSVLHPSASSREYDGHSRPVNRT